MQFHTEPPLQFKLKDPTKIKKWLNNVIETENHEAGVINYIFCTDEYLYNINMEYLQHDTYTDIITFDNSEEENLIESDMFISIERIQDNAKQRNIPFETELQRVLVHGILHLLGHNDKTDEQKVAMRKTEDHYLALYES